MSMNPPPKPPSRMARVQSRVDKMVSANQNLVYLVIGYLMAIALIALTRGW